MDLLFENYKITWESIGKGIPESLQLHLEKMHGELQNPKRKTVDKLKKLIKKYPNNPQLRNYLAVAYMTLGEKEKAWVVNDVLAKKHPGYFFAKINKANEYFEKNQLDKIVELLGKGFHLKELYPNRDIYHVSEFLSMQEMAVKYYARKGDFEQAEKRLELIEEIDEGSGVYHQAKRMLENIRMDSVLRRFEEEKEHRIRPQPSSTFDEAKELGKTQLEETHRLYEQTDLSVEFIDRYLNLDKEKLVTDLEIVLQKSYYRHKNKTPVNDAAVYAFFILGELDAVESLPVILEMMRQDQAYFDDVFGTIYTELGWIPLLKLGKSRLNLIADYLKLPGLYTYFRSAALDALAQVAYHYPDKKKEVVQIYKGLLDFYAGLRVEDNIIDTELNGFLVADIIGLKQEQLLPEIRILYEKGYVSASVCGKLEEVEQQIKVIEDERENKRKILPLNEILEMLSEEADTEETDAFSLMNLVDKRSHEDGGTYRKDYVKTGRNDPCPCGSGKKFKKCCLGRGIHD